MKLSKLFHFLHIVFRFCLFAVLLIFFMYVIANMVLSSNSMQHWTKDKLVNYLNQHSQNKVSVDDLQFDLIQGFRIKGALLLDQQKDTILYAAQLNIGLKRSIASLIQNSLEIKSVEMSQAVLKMIYYPNEQEHSIDWFISHLNFAKSGSKSNNKFKFNIEKINLNSIRFQKEDIPLGKYESYSFQNVKADVKILDLLANYMTVDNVFAEGADLKVKVFTPSNYPEGVPVYNDSLPKKCKNKFALNIMHGIVESGKFKFDNNDHVNTSTEFLDRYHILANNLHLKLSNFNYTDLQFLGKLENFEGEAENFGIRKMKCDWVEVNSQRCKLTGLELATNHSYISDGLEMQYDRYPDFKDFNNKVFINFSGKSTQINLSDLIYLAPKLNTKTFFRQNNHADLCIEGQIVGKVNSLKAPELKFSLSDKIYFDGQLSSRNLTVPGKELLNVRVKDLSSNVSEILDLFNIKKVPDTYRKIGHFQFVGDFDGFLEDFVSNGYFKTELGNVKLDLRLNLRPGPEHAEFSGAFELHNFDLGKLSSNPDLQKASLVANIRNGSGLNWQSLNADLELKSNAFTYKNYTYKNINFNGKFNKTLLDGKFKVEDENLDFNFDGVISDINATPNFNFKTDIKKINFKAINFSQKPISITGLVMANVRGKKLDDLLGNIHVQNLKFSDSIHKDFIIKDIVLHQNQTGAEKELNMQSDLGYVHLNGDYKISQLHNTMLSILRSNIPMLDDQFKTERPLAALDHFEYSMQLKNIQKVLDYFSSPIQVNTATIKGEAKGKEGAILNAADFDYFKWNTLELFNTKTQSFVTDGVVNNRIKTDKVILNSNEILYHLNIDQSLDKNQYVAKITSYDSTFHDILFASDIGLIYADRKYNINFPNNEFIFNKLKWKLEDGNSIQIAKDAFTVTKFSMTDSFRYIVIQDIDHKGLDIKADGFNVSLINNFIKNKDIRLSGLMNFTISAPNVLKLESVSGKVQLFQFHVNKTNYGPIAIDYFMPDPKKPFQLNIVNQFKEHMLTAKGTMNIPLIKNYPLPRFDTDLDLDIVNFPASFLQNFIASISNTTGTFQNKVNLKISDKILYLNGDLSIKDVSTKINYLGTTYHATDKIIKLRDQRFLFDNIELYDALNNPIKLNGYLQHENLARYFVDVRLNSPQALILDTKKADNIYYYGYGICDFNAHFFGPLTKIDVDIDARSLKDSKLVIPVRYDQDATDNLFVRFRDTAAPKPILNQAVAIKGMNFNMNMAVTPEAEVSIVFNEVYGDVIKGNGYGNLQIASLRDNSFTVKGDYVVESGQYLFTLLNFVNKPFKIKRGGTIHWTGDPLNADVKLEAKYEGLYSSMNGFLQEYISGDQKLQTEASSRTNVDLKMLISGSLLQPKIDFKLDFPNLTGELKNYADLKLRILDNNQDQLNQQVFGLLVFGSFLNSNNPFESGVTSTVGTTTINTLSELLSNQLSLFVTNILSDAFHDSKFISGLDYKVGYDLVEDAQFGNLKLDQGEIVFSFKHRLLNDQWAVTLGGNYNTQKSGIAGNSTFNPESVIEWNTPLPGLKLRVYYKSDNSIEGVKHKVGTGIAYRKEFDNLFDFKKAIGENQSKFPK